MPRGKNDHLSELDKIRLRKQQRVRSACKKFLEIRFPAIYKRIVKQVEEDYGE